MTTPAGEGHSAINTIERYVLMGFFGLFLLFFLPFTQDFYYFHKWLLLIATALVVLILWSIKTMQTNTIRFSLSPKTTAFLLLSLAGFVSLLFGSPNKVEALLSPLGLPTLLSLTLLLLIGQRVIDTHLRFTLKWLLIGTTGIASIIAVYQFIGFGKLMFPEVSYLADPLWTPVGSSIAYVAIALLVLPLLIDEAYSAIKHKEDLMLAGSIILMVTIGAGIILTLIHLVPRYTQITILPSDGWPMTLEVLKNPKQAITGVGVENFISAFTAGRPIRLNNSPMWNARFGSNATFLFHSTATMGLLGAVGILFCVKCFWPFGKPRHTIGIGESMTGMLAIAMLLLLPPLFPVLVVLACLLVIQADPHEHALHWRIGKHVRFIPVLLLLLAVIIFIASSIPLYRVYQGERDYYRSLLAREKNDGKETYTKQIQAIQWNGGVSRYHYQLSQTSLAIADFLAANPTGTATDSSKKILTDTEKQQITGLIQQSIREAKVTLALSPQDVFVWENIAQIYSRIESFTPDANTWAIASYQQAIILDPTNPALRISLGGKFLQKGEWDSAVREFTIAGNLKPDHANAHFNLAYAYEKRKDFLLAAREMKQTLGLVPVASEDYTKAKKLYDELLTYLTDEEKSSLTISSSTPNEK